MLSPRGGQEQALTRGHGHLRTASVLTVDSPLAPGSRADPPTPATAAAADVPQRFGTKWQETERVVCTPVASGEALVLQPGRNTLCFEVRSLQPAFCLIDDKESVGDRGKVVGTGDALETRPVCAAPCGGQTGQSSAQAGCWGGSRGAWATCSPWGLRRCR